MACEAVLMGTHLLILPPDARGSALLTLERISIDEMETRSNFLSWSRLREIAIKVARVAAPMVVFRRK